MISITSSAEVARWITAGDQAHLKKTAGAGTIRSMAKISAGLLMYRKRGGELEVLLVHLGGPFWKRKDEGAWFISKGEINPGEVELDAARREFQEETGLIVSGEFLALGKVKHKSGKTVVAWGFEGDCDPC